MKFNEKIIRLRKNKGMTQDEFASAVGVSRQAVYKWECGQSYPEVAKLLEIKMLFNISIDDLLDENYEVPSPEKKKKRAYVKDSERAEKAEADVACVAVEDAEITEEKEYNVMTQENLKPEENEVNLATVAQGQNTALYSQKENPYKTESAFARKMSEGGSTNRFATESAFAKKMNESNSHTENEPTVQESKAATAQEAEQVKEEIVKEEIIVSNETSEIKTEKEEAAETVLAEEVVVEYEGEPVKKKGFFSRLFGRK